MATLKVQQTQDYQGEITPFGRIRLFLAERMGHQRYDTVSIYSKKTKENGGGLYVKKVPKGFNLLNIDNEIPFDTNLWSVTGEIIHKIIEGKEEPKPFYEIPLEGGIDTFADVITPIVLFLKKHAEELKDANIVFEINTSKTKILLHIKK